MNVTIFGAGAIGCLIGGKLLQAGDANIHFIARGARLQALQNDGLTLVSGDKKWHTPVSVTNDPAILGVQDMVILCTKSHQVADAVEQMQPLIGPETILLTVINGMPWWYFQKLGGEFDGRSLKSLDPEGRIAKAINPDHIIGGANYLGATMMGDATVKYVDVFEKSLVIGELDGQLTPRLQKVTDLLASAGLDPQATDDVRNAIWMKLWGNVAFNPVSALTHATLDAIAVDYDDTDLIMAIMNETRLIAEKLDITFPDSTKTRIKRTAVMKGHKTSMLIDIEQGRKTEINAIVGAVREIGHWMEESTPHLNGLYSLVRLKEKFYKPHPDDVA